MSQPYAGKDTSTAENQHLVRVQRRVAKLTVGQRTKLVAELNNINASKQASDASRRRTTQLLAYYTLADDNEIAQSGESSGSETLPGDSEARTGLDEAKLRETVKALLPEYMCPARFIALGRLPTLPNGKLDSRALPPVKERVATDIPGAASEVQEPGDPLPAGSKGDTGNACDTLCTILAELLGTDDVRPDDNFFQIGGDSIVAIQFVSRAREQGIILDVAMLSTESTLQALANAGAQEQQHATAASTSPTGDAPLTPIQRWFLSIPHPEPAHWNVAGKISLDSPVDTDLLRAAIEFVASCFPELGTSFHHTDGHWHAHIPGFTLPASCISTMSKRTNSSVDAGHIEQAIEQAQQSFSLESGWMVHFVIVEPEAGKAESICWVMHHLLVDPISGTQLTNMIRSTCQALASNQAPAITSTNSMSMRQVAMQLDGLDAGDTDNLSNPAPSPTNDIDATARTSRATEADSKTVGTRLDAGLTSALLAAASNANVNTLEQLLTALTGAMKLDAPVPNYQLFVETHGRDSLPGADTSSTIGWLTSFYALDLSAVTSSTGQSAGQPLQTSGESAINNVLKAVKNTVRADKSGNDRFLIDHYKHNRYAPGWNSENTTVLVNYLGAQPATQPAHYWHTEFLMLDSLRAPSNLRAFDIEINAQVSDGELHLRWQYSPGRVREAAMEELVNKTVLVLKTIASIGAQQDASALLTPSDFPDVDMSQSELDDLLDSLE